jgi:hypothetical protein
MTAATPDARDRRAGGAARAVFECRGAMAEEKFYPQKETPPERGAPEA